MGGRLLCFDQVTSVAGLTIAVLLPPLSEVFASSTVLENGVVDTFTVDFPFHMRHKAREAHGSTGIYVSPLRSNTRKSTPLVPNSPDGPSILAVDRPSRLRTVITKESPSCSASNAQLNAGQEALGPLTPWSI